MIEELKITAQNIAMILDKGNVGLANDIYRDMLLKHPLCKWEQIAFGEVVRSYRKSCKVFVTVCDDKPLYRLEFHGKHIGHFENEHSLNRKINELYF